MQLLGSGRTADVFALDDHRVLRRYRMDFDTAGEAEIMRQVAGHGFPVPEVFAASGRDLVMQRLHGPTMAQALLDGELSAEDGGVMLAELHGRLHGIPGGIVHLDLHPENVVLVRGGPVVIDWSNSRVGRAGVDVALTALILAEVAARPELREPVRLVLTAFLRTARVPAPSDVDDAVAWRRADPAIGAGQEGTVDEALAFVRSISVCGMKQS